MAYSIRFMPRSLTQPGGAIFLDPAHRVSREELDRQDARWRALRERAYARAWSDDATLVGGLQHYAATALREFEDRTLGRNAGVGGSGGSNRRIMSAGTFASDEASTLRNGRSLREGSLRRGPQQEPSNTGRLSTMLSGTRRHRRFRNTLRRLVGARS